MKRYLTQASLDHLAYAQARIVNHRDWHRKIWQAFNPVEGDGGPRQFLYAVEETQAGVRALILSGEVPTRPDWCPAAGWATKAIPDGFLAHSRYAFSLTANPTRQCAGKRLSIAQASGPDDDTDGALRTWIERKGTAGGFLVLQSKTSIEPLQVETFPTSDRSRFMTFHYVRFQGVLDVTDSNAFRAAFNHGIGRGRAFGCGLLLLKPIQ